MAIYQVGQGIGQIGPKAFFGKLEPGRARNQQAKIGRQGEVPSFSRLLLI